MKYKELNQRIDDMKGEIIEGIRQSVSIYSVKSNPEPDAPFGKGPKDALENAIEQAEKLGLKAKNIDMTTLITIYIAGMVSLHSILLPDIVSS